MFAKPAYAQIVAILSALALTFVVAVAPIDFWSSQIDPVGSSFRTLARAPYFFIGTTDVEGQLSEEIPAWRTLAGSPKADSLFRQLFVRGTTPARVYALVGLSIVNPVQFRRIRVRLQGDSAHLTFSTPCDQGSAIPIGQVVTDARLATWASLLSSWAPIPHDSVRACAV
jgi:hypothetical protein